MAANLLRRGVQQYFKILPSIREVCVKGNLLRCFTSLNNTFNSCEKKGNLVIKPADEEYKTKVHPDIIDILEKSRPKCVGVWWHRPKYSARRVAELRKKYEAQGYFWPRKPLIDRKLDKSPDEERLERRKERLAQIEINMKNMPKYIEEYRERIRGLREKRRAEKRIAAEREKEAKRLGMHPNDPRILAQSNQQSKTQAKVKKTFVKAKKMK